MLSDRVFFSLVDGFMGGSLRATYGDRHNKSCFRVIGLSRLSRVLHTPLDISDISVTNTHMPCAHCI